MSNFFIRLVSGAGNYPLILFVSLATRLYRLDSNPVWFDEIYSYQVSQQPFAILVRNSFFDPSPPLYFLLLKLSAFATPSEIAVRWFSAVCGVITLIGVYHIARRCTSPSTAMLVWLLMAISPTLMYFSQEARPYIVELAIATVCTLLVFELTLARQFQKQATQFWLLWMLLSICGFYVAYSYLMILAIQSLYLIFIYRFDLKVILIVAIVALALSPLLPLIMGTLGSDLSRTVDSNPLTLTLVLQALLAGDPIRYGTFWGSYFLPLIFSVVILWGCYHAIKLRRNFQYYLIVQLIAPLIFFFGIGVPLLGVHMPSFQSRQFLVLLPSLLWLFAYGIEDYQRKVSFWIGHFIFYATLVTVVVVSFVALDTYWTTPKSPEGEAILFLNKQIGPGEAVVSLHFSLDAAADFYLKKTQPAFAKPQTTAGGYMFSRSLLGLRGQLKTKGDISVDSIRQYPNFWILYDTRKDIPVLPVLRQNCQTVFTQRFMPFEILKISDCVVTDPN